MKISSFPFLKIKPSLQPLSKEGGCKTEKLLTQFFTLQHREDYLPLFKKRQQRTAGIFVSLWSKPCQQVQLWYLSIHPCEEQSIAKSPTLSIIIVNQAAGDRATIEKVGYAPPEQGAGKEGPVPHQCEVSSAYVPAFSSTVSGEDEDAFCNTPNTHLQWLSQSKSFPLLGGGMCVWEICRQRIRTTETFCSCWSQKPSDLLMSILRVGSIQQNRHSGV